MIVRQGMSQGGTFRCRIPCDPGSLVTDIIGQAQIYFVTSLESGKGRFCSEQDRLDNRQKSALCG